MDRSGPGGKSSDTSEREPSLFHSLATCRPLCPSGKESPRLQGRLGGLPRRKKRGLGGGQTGSCRIQCPLPQSCCSFTSRSRGRPLLPLPFPFPLPQLKAGWKAFAGWPQLLCPCPEGGASAFAPPELWLAGSPPIPWGCCCRGGGGGARVWQSGRDLQRQTGQGPSSPASFGGEQWHLQAGTSQFSQMPEATLGRKT